MGDKERQQQRRGSRRRGRVRRRGAAFLLALFVMGVTTMTVLSILDTQTLQYTALRNTMDYDRARYLAEAGVQHALAILEQDFTSQSLRQNGIGPLNFPAGSNDSYSARVADGPNGTVVITGTGVAGSFTRRLQIVAKMGG